MPRAPSPSVRAYLASRVRSGIKFGLETMRALCEALGHPERQAPALLVAGTNGKGSVVAYLDAVLRASGLHVGRYTSPHLVRVQERICVGGREISSRDFDRAVDRVRRAAALLVRAGALSLHPTYFEVLTAAAFLHFRRAGVNAAVLEVGLGGRLDATNVSDPLVSGVVSIDRDHEAHLGTTLQAIAREKAGVLRPGRATVVGPVAREAREALEHAARSIGARLLDAAIGVDLRGDGDVLEIRTPRRLYRGVRPLPGRHQRDNVVVALRILEEAEASGLPVDLDAVPGAVSRTRWPGRLQWVPGRPPLLLDGAHNPAGAAALAAYVAALRPFVLLFGALGDKDVAGIARPLFPLAHEIVLTRARAPRALSPDALARSAGSSAARAHRRSGVASALGLARRLAGPSRPVVVAGSLYLVGEVTKTLERPSERAGGSGSVRASRARATSPSPGRRRSRSRRGR